MPQRLVIDASVARAAGGKDAVHEAARACRDALLGVLRYCHQIVATDDILSEWRRHRSRFSSTWLVSMYARKRVWRGGVPTNADLHEQIASSIDNARRRAAFEKDFHLVEAAIATDQIIMTLDKELKGILFACCGSFAQLQRILWPDPAEPAIDLDTWLKEGARPETRLLLCQSD
jgi:hypothetical protein